MYIDESMTHIVEIPQDLTQAQLDAIFGAEGLSCVLKYNRNRFMLELKLGEGNVD